jgi:hypothetical protein
MSSFAKIGVFYANSYIIGSTHMSSSYQTVEPSARWLERYAAAEKYTMLADLNLYGKYLVHSVGKDSQPLVQGYTLERFVQVIQPSAEKWRDRPDIVAIDLESAEPTIGFVWLLFDPLQDYAAELRSNHDLNVIYDDGSIWLGKPVEE